jgi:hypothetical protein
MVHCHLSICLLISLTCVKNLIPGQSLPESTHPQVLILSSFIPFRIRVYEKMGGGAVIVNRTSRSQANRTVPGEMKRVSLMNAF